MTREAVHKTLTVSEFYERLQYEYIANSLRAKIYPSRRWKNFFERVMKAKKDKIEKISVTRLHNASSIFTDEALMRSFEDKVLNPYGYPNWYYNDRDTEELKENDFVFYYNTGISVVAFSIEQNTKSGTVVDRSFKDKTVTVSLVGSNKIVTYDSNMVKRID